MNTQKDIEVNQESLNPSDRPYSLYDISVAAQNHPDLIQPLQNPNVMPLSRSEGLQQVIGELRIGQRIHDELKQQGRSVAWLARKLNVERTSLYYTFRQNSIDVELLLRISHYLEHNFLQDVADVYKSCVL